ncbi:MAG TPA: J domain-containing protein [Thermomicrobiales bacterium]|nr:J domain-containing protein [Thermomicrobiales bacterium]
MPVDFKDYYSVLGVERTASDSEIKTAFRKKARELHPDVNRDDPDAEERFKEVNEAYEVLSDAEKRRMYDRFGEDWQRYRDAGVNPDDFTGYTSGGGASSQQGYQDFEQWFTGGGPSAPTGSWEWTERGGYQETNGRFSDFFNLLFGNEAPGAGARDRFRRPRPLRGDDIEVAAEISLREAYEGTGRKLTLQTPSPCPTCGGTGIARGATCPTCDGTGQVTKSKTLEVKIPKGVKTGSRVRIAGQGGLGANGGPNGDVYLVITVHDDTRFTREGDNLKTSVSVPLYTAILGGETVVPTMTGRVALTIPAGTQNDKIFRLRGKGMPKTGKNASGSGDLLVSVNVQLPGDLTDQERELFTQLKNLRQ